MHNDQLFPEHNLSKTRMLELARTWWLLVVIVFAAGTLTMYVILPIFFTELYETNVQLLVKAGRENVETPATVVRGQIVSTGVRSADINSEVQILSSRALVENVVDRLGPDAFKSVLREPSEWWGYPKYYFKLTAHAAKEYWHEFLIFANLDKRVTPREDAILHLADGVKVEPVKDSDILTLKIQTPSPELCVKVANALIDLYMQRRQAVRRATAGAGFFQVEMNQAGDRLLKSLQKRAAVRTHWDLSSPAEQRTAYLKEMASIQSELVQNQGEIEKLKKQRELMVLKSAAMPDLVPKEKVEGNNPAIQAVKDRITVLRMERAKLSTRYQPDSETMKKIDFEIADLEAALRNENSTILNSMTSETNPTKREFHGSMDLHDVQIAGLESRNRYLQGPLASVTAKVRNLETGIDAFESAEREYRMAEQDYLQYSRRLEESRMSEELDSDRVANVGVVAPPETPIKPVAPRKIFLMEIAMGVSLVLGLALAAFLETTEDRILDERSVRSLAGIYYLGTAEIEDAA